MTVYYYTYTTCNDGLAVDSVYKSVLLFFLYTPLLTAIAEKSIREMADLCSR